MTKSDMPSERSFDYFVNLELPNSKSLDKIFDPNDSLTIFDIGTCEGEDTIRYLMKYPRAKVHSFEPVPGNFKIAKSNIEKYGFTHSVRLNPIALSSETGEFDLFVSSGEPTDIEREPNWNYGNKSSSLLEPAKTLEVTPWLEFENKISVKTETLENYCKHNSIKHIDLIHMDVQGAELMVLNGAGPMIKDVSAIWLEVESVELYKNQPLKKDIEKFMKKNGFRLDLDTVDHIAGDQFYINKSLVGGILKKLTRKF